MYKIRSVCQGLQETSFSVFFIIILFIIIIINTTSFAYIEAAKHRMEHWNGSMWVNEIKNSTVTMKWKYK